MLRFETYKHGMEYPKNLHHYINMKFWDWTDEYRNHYNDKIKYALDIEDSNFYYHHYYPYLHYLAGKVDNKDIQDYKNVFMIKKYELGIYRIKKLMRKNDFSFKQIDKYLEKDDGYIEDIFDDLIQLDFEILDKLSCLFNCSFLYLLGRTWNEDIDYNYISDDS